MLERETETERQIDRQTETDRDRQKQGQRDGRWAGTEKGQPDRRTETENRKVGRHRRTEGMHYMLRWLIGCTQRMTTTYCNI